MPKPSTPELTKDKTLENSNIQWREQNNYNSNAQENTNTFLINQRETIYGSRYYNGQKASDEIGKNSPKLTTRISSQDKQPRSHKNPYTYTSPLESNNQDSISAMENTRSKKNLPVTNYSVSKPSTKNKISKSKATQNVLLENTFGKGDNNSFRQKRKGPNFSLTEESNTVGYTMFNMDGVDILYSFPKENPTKASKRQKKQVSMTFQRKKKEVTNHPYHKFDIDKKYTGNISVKYILSTTLILLMQ